MTRNEKGLLLVHKAEEDMQVLNLLRNQATSTDAIWGFHAQQAVEKLLKSLLIGRGIEFPFTHRLMQLRDMLADNRFQLPDEFESLLDLTPYSVEWRYSVLSPGPSEPPIDRTAVYQLVDELRKTVLNELRADPRPIE